MSLILNCRRGKINYQELYIKFTLRLEQERQRQAEKARQELEEAERARQALAQERLNLERLVLILGVVCCRARRPRH